jgi:GNAT superfamily N-acetyltransferase
MSLPSPGDRIRDRIRVRPARPDEAPALSELALRSKGHWGYDAAFLAACRDELTLKRADLTPGNASVAEDEAGRVLGFVLIDGAAPRGRLDMLFVDPSAIGSGVGRRLFREGLATARRLGMRSLAIDADPNAEPFYRAMGARVVGTVPSGSVAGRVLPLMETDVPRTDDAPAPAGALR